MSATLKIYCKNTGEYLPIHGGETLQEIANRLAPRLGTLQLICAAVNNKTEPLQYQLSAPNRWNFSARIPRQAHGSTSVHCA